MLIVVKKVHPGYDGYKTLIVTEHRRRWFEIWLLFMKPFTRCYLGRGTKWVVWPDFIEAPAHICKQMQRVEQRHLYIKRNKR